MSGNLNINHYSLNAGEVSPRMAARQDQNKYLACCLTMLNARPLVVGGATWREGTQYVATTKTVAGHQEKIIRPFVPARAQAYVLEFGHEYVRVYRSGAPLFSGEGTNANTASKRFSMMGFASGMPWEEPLPIPDGLLASEDRFSLLAGFGLNSIGEIATPYADTDLAELFLVQSIDVCYLLHRNYPVHKLTRISQTEFTLTQVNFNPPATLEEEPTGDDLGIGTLTPGATTGTGITFEGENSGFEGADVGRIIVSGGSRGVIASVVDADTITVDIIDAFINTSPIDGADWRMVLSPQTTLDITDGRQEVGQVVTLTAAAGAFRAADAGKWITMFGGLLKIDVVNSDTSVTATIKSRLIDIETNNPDATRAWTLEVAAWSDALGYPSCGCFFQGRFWLCKGLTINGSVTNDFENFGKGGDDDSAIARTISDDDVDAIVWIKGDKELKIGTFSGIYQASPTTQSGALTPSSFKVEPIDPNGAARIPPLRVSPVLIYVDASKRELRELSYSFAEDNFKSPHLFRLAEHFMNGHFIKEAAYTSAPDSIVFVVRDDGVLLGQVYEQVENVIGWYRIETDGEIKSVCVIPRPETGKDWVWVIVERENGIYVEFFEPDHTNTGREWHDLQTDSAVITTHDANFVVAGLDHLEGQTVWVVGDGMLFNSRKNDLGQLVSTAVVEDGQITMDPEVSVSKVEIGLHYDGKIVPVPPRIDPEAGSQFIAKGYVQVGINIDRALGMRLRAYRVNRSEPGDDEIIGEELVYRKPYHAMDRQVPLQIGQKCVFNLGYDFARIEILRDKPFPAEILSVIGKLHVGDMWDCDTDDMNPAFVLTPETNEDSSLGFLNKECGFTCPLGQYAEAVYDGSESNSGPAIRMTSQASLSVFRGLVALYVPEQEVIALLLYDGEPLAGLGTVVTTISLALVAGDVLRLESDTTLPTTYRVKVNDDVVITEVISDDDLYIGNGCVGFVRVAEVTEDLTPVAPAELVIVKLENEERADDVMADDAELAVPIAANETRVVTFFLFIHDASTDDFDITVTVPSGATGNWGSVNFVAGPKLDFGTAATYGATSSGGGIWEFRATVFNGATPGNVAINYAQNVNHGTALVVQAGSIVRSELAT